MKVRPVDHWTRWLLEFEAEVDREDGRAMLKKTPVVGIL